MKYPVIIPHPTVAKPYQVLPVNFQQILPKQTNQYTAILLSPLMTTETMTSCQAWTIC